MTSILDKILVAALALLLVVVFVQNSRLSTRTAELDAAQAQLAAEKLRGLAWEDATYELRTGLSQCQSQWDTANEDAIRAHELAEAYREENVKQYLAFQERWRSRTQDCAASLQQMQSACEAQIGEY
jgi:hypothetical protein